MGLVTTVLHQPRLADYIELTKPGIVALVLVTVLAGFYLGAADGIAGLLLFHTLLGSTLVAAGSNALNQVVERDIDGLMLRTRSRPLPAGRLKVVGATIFAWTVTLSGVTYLAIQTNALVAVLAAATAVLYVFAYTPLKRKTSLSTLVGAIPGALPIAGGWAAARGTLEPTAWALFGLLFLWQLPHFLALAWMCREDYARADLKMLSVTSGATVTFRQALLYAVALLPVSLVPTVLGVTGIVYFGGAIALSVGLIWVTVSVARDPSRARAKRLFSATVLYLPAVLILMMVDKVP